MVWVNGWLNSGLVNLVPESRLPDLYKSIPFTGKRPRRPQTGIKDASFRWEDPKTRVPFTFQTDFPENFCKW